MINEKILRKYFEPYLMNSKAKTLQNSMSGIVCQQKNKIIKKSIVDTNTLSRVTFLTVLARF